jgi:pre-mRNA-splicing factor 38B
MCLCIDVDCRQWCFNAYQFIASHLQEFFPSPGSSSKAVTIGTFARDILLDQYYFETLFPRIPKGINDEILQNLRDMGLPTKALGNGGQGGPDRRGVDDGMRRPASVKASLSVALGQRAPNRAGAREEGRGLGVDRAGRGSDGNRNHGKNSSDVGYRSRRHSRSRSRDRTRSPSDGPRHRDYRYYDSERRFYRKEERYDGRYERCEYEGPDRKREPLRSRHASSRSPPPEVSREAGRDVADVFREKLGPTRPTSNVKRFY